MRIKMQDACPSHLCLSQPHSQTTCEESEMSSALEFFPPFSVVGFHHSLRNTSAAISPMSCPMRNLDLVGRILITLSQHCALNIRRTRLTYTATVQTFPESILIQSKRLSWSFKMKTMENRGLQWEQRHARSRYVTIALCPPPWQP